VTGPVADLLQRALGAVGDEDSALRAQLMGRLAAALAYADIEQRKPGLAQQALEMARQVADKATLADVIASAQWAGGGPDVLPESLVMVEELGRIARQIGDRRLRALAHTWLLHHRLELGDIDAVERELTALERLAEGRQDRHFAWLLAMLRASRAHLAGRLEDCETLALDALAHRFEGHDENAVLTFGTQMLVLRDEQGRLDELVETVEHFAAQYPRTAGPRCALAYIYTQLERTAQARDELEALARADFCDLPYDAYWLANLSTLCDVVVFLGDAPRAHLLYKLLLPCADRCVVTGAHLCHGSVSRFLGRLATTLSRYEDAARHFEHALTMNAQIRSPLWIAHTQHDYARMLLLRNDAGARETALGMLDPALATAQQLGLQALADKAKPLKLVAKAAGPVQG
jgi:tetratricopeptide (TPR) repeat protein